jgi:hypothetical protein
LSLLRSYLESNNLLSPADLEVAVRHQNQQGGSLDTALLELGLVTAAELDAHLGAACGLPTPPARLIETGPTRPWGHVPKALLDIGWVMPLAIEDGQVFVAVHPDLPDNRLGQLYRQIRGLQPMVAPECVLAKLAAERGGGIVAPRYAMLVLDVVDALHARDAAHAAPASGPHDAAASRADDPAAPADNPAAPADTTRPAPHDLTTRTVLDGPRDPNRIVLDGPRIAHDRPADPRAAGLADPRGPDRVADPRTADPRAADPRAADPRAADPRVAHDTRTVLDGPRVDHDRPADPRLADPRVADPRVADPRTADPRVAPDTRTVLDGPRVAHDRPADPRLADPRLGDTTRTVLDGPRVAHDRPADPRLADPRLGDTTRTVLDGPRVAHDGRATPDVPVARTPHERRSSDAAARAARTTDPAARTVHDGLIPRTTDPAARTVHDGPIARVADPSRRDALSSATTLVGHPVPPEPVRQERRSGPVRAPTPEPEPDPSDSFTDAAADSLSAAITVVRPIPGPHDPASAGTFPVPGAGSFAHDSGSYPAASSGSFPDLRTVGGGRPRRPTSQPTPAAPVPSDSRPAEPAPVAEPPPREIPDRGPHPARTGQVGPAARAPAPAQLPLVQRLAPARAALAMARERDRITECLVRAAIQVAPRVALFGVKREGLRALAAPGSALHLPRSLVIPIPDGSLLDRAVAGEIRLRLLTEPQLAFAVGRPLGIPCLLEPVYAQTRCVLMLYIDRSGSPFDGIEQAAVRDLCDVAGVSLEALLRIMGLGSVRSEPTPPSRDPASSLTSVPVVRDDAPTDAAADTLPDPALSLGEAAPSADAWLAGPTGDRAIAAAPDGSAQADPPVRAGLDTTAVSPVAWADRDEQPRDDASTDDVADPTLVARTADLDVPAVDSVLDDAPDAVADRPGAHATEPARADDPPLADLPRDLLAEARDAYRSSERAEPSLVDPTAWSSELETPPDPARSPADTDIVVIDPAAGSSDLETPPAPRNPADADTTGIDPAAWTARPSADASDPSADAADPSADADETSIADRDLTDRDLTARDLTDRDLTDRDLTARDLTARDLTDRDLTARDLTDREPARLADLARAYLARDATPTARTAAAADRTEATPTDRTAAAASHTADRTAASHTAATSDTDAASLPTGTAAPRTDADATLRADADADAVTPRADADANAVPPDPDPAPSRPDAGGDPPRTAAPRGDDAAAAAPPSAARPRSRRPVIALVNPIRHAPRPGPWTHAAGVYGQGPATPPPSPAPGTTGGPAADVPTPDAPERDAPIRPDPHAPTKRLPTASVVLGDGLYRAVVPVPPSSPAHPRPPAPAPDAPEPSAGPEPDAPGAGVRARRFTPALDPTAPVPRDSSDAPVPEDSPTAPVPRDSLGVPVPRDSSGPTPTARAPVPRDSSGPAPTARAPVPSDSSGPTDAPVPRDSSDPTDAPVPRDSSDPTDAPVPGDSPLAPAAHAHDPLAAPVPQDTSALPADAAPRAAEPDAAPSEDPPPAVLHMPNLVAPGARRAAGKRGDRTRPRPEAVVVIRETPTGLSIPASLIAPAPLPGAKRRGSKNPEHPTPPDADAITLNMPRLVKAPTVLPEPAEPAEPAPLADDLAPAPAAAAEPADAAPDAASAEPVPEDMSSAPAAAPLDPDLALEAYLRAPDDPDALAGLRGLDDAGLARLAARFPGPIDPGSATDVRQFPPPSVHGPLLRACAQLGARVVPFVLELVDHPRPQIRFYASFLFQELRDPRCLRPLAAHAFDPDPDVRVIATRVLESYNRVPGFVEATEVVRAELRGRDRERALLAVEAAGTLRDTRAVPTLIDLLSVRDKQIREAALEGLCSITAKHHGYRPAKWRSWYDEHGRDPRILWVIDALRHRDAAVRRWAADELHRVTGHRIPAPPEGEKATPKYVLHAWETWWEAHAAEYPADPPEAP